MFNVYIDVTIETKSRCKFNPVVIDGKKAYQNLHTGSFCYILGSLLTRTNLLREASYVVRN